MRQLLSKGNCLTVGLNGTLLTSASSASAKLDGLRSVSVLWHNNETFECPSVCIHSFHRKSLTKNLVIRTFSSVVCLARMVNNGILWRHLIRTARSKALLTAFYLVYGEQRLRYQMQWVSTPSEFNMYK